MGTPSLPGFSSFQELNVRTYVHDAAGTPGVWFYSLDANCWPAVKAARWSFHLPYFWATMSYTRVPSSGRVHYVSRRKGAPPSMTSRCEYEGSGLPRQANDPESFEFFLLERYILFAEKNGRVYSGRVHHPPYPITDAEVLRCDDHSLELDGFASPGRPPDHQLMSRGMDVEVFALQRLPR